MFRSFKPCFFFRSLKRKNHRKKTSNSIVDSQASQWAQAAALAFSLIAPDALSLASQTTEATENAIDATLWLCLSFSGTVGVLGGLFRRKGAAGSTWLEVALQLAAAAAVA